MHYSRMCVSLYVCGRDRETVEINGIDWSSEVCSWQRLLTAVCTYSSTFELWAWEYSLLAMAAWFLDWNAYSPGESLVRTERLLNHANGRSFYISNMSFGNVASLYFWLGSKVSSMTVSGRQTTTCHFIYLSACPIDTFICTVWAKIFMI